MRAPGIALVVVAALWGCGAEAPTPAPAPPEPSPAALPPVVADLRDGGYVVALRHAATDTGADMTDDLSDCSRQRNLSVAGRRQAEAIGRTFRTVGIPVGEVLASPFCRTRDTARLAFGGARRTRALLSPEFFRNRRAFRRRGIRRLLARRPAAGRNTVLVSHGTAIGAVTGIEPEEGDAVVVRPRGDDGFEVEGTVPAAGWERLASGG